MKAAAEVAKQGIEVEIIDLRTIIPFDHETCISSVARTGKLLILQESQWHGGLGHSIQNRIIEEAFWALEAQPRIIGALDTPVPFSPPLEDYFIPDVTNVVEGIKNICS